MRAAHCFKSSLCCSARRTTSQYVGYSVCNSRWSQSIVNSRFGFMVAGIARDQQWTQAEAVKTVATFLADDIISALIINTACFIVFFNNTNSSFSFYDAPAQLAHICCVVPTFPDCTPHDTCQLSDQ